MKILGIEHIGIATNSIDAAAPFWKLILKLYHRGDEIVEEQGVKTSIYEVDKSKIELLEPTNKDSLLEKYLQNKGQGIHHLCLEVENIDDAIEELKTHKIELINTKPSIGVEGYKVVFIHPRETGGVLLELAEKPDEPVVK